MIYGTVRRLSVKNHINIEPLKNEPRFQLINLDLTDDYSIRDAIVGIQPDYFLNFAQSLLMDRGIIRFKHGIQMQLQFYICLKAFVSLHLNVDSIMRIK